MPVAPSFQNFIKLSNPYIKNGKAYIKIRNPKKSTEREVRWYDEAEYAKIYGKKLINTSKGYANLKETRGFKNGPILVIRNNREEDEEWLRQSVARYAVGIGWYVPSTEVFPNDAPPHFKYLLLGWNEFKNEDDFHMKEPTTLLEILKKKARNKEWVLMSSSLPLATCLV